LDNRLSTLAARFNRAALIVLVAGVVAAGAIYATTDDARPDGVTEIIDGQVHVIDPQDDPRYQAQVERMGGSMGLRMVRFESWFDSLWRGRTLATTIAVLALVIAGALALVAREIGASAALRGSRPNP
jgi:hypothetical protein